jgi:hypothetical protein
MLKPVATYVESAWCQRLHLSLTFIEPEGASHGEQQPTPSTIASR